MTPYTPIRKRRHLVSLHIDFSNLRYLAAATLAAISFVTASAAPGTPGFNPNDEFYKTIASEDLETIAEKGRRCIAENHPDSAIQYFSVVNARYTPDMSDSDKVVCLKAMNNLGYLHFFINNDPIQSFYFLLRGLNLSEDMRSTEYLPYIYVNLGNVYSTLDDYDSAIDYFRKSFYSSLKEKKHDITVVSLIGIANLVYTSGREPLGSIAKEIELFEKSGIKDVPLLDYTNNVLEGMRLVENREYARGIECFEKAKKAIDTTQTPERYEYVISSLMAGAYMKEGDYRKSLEMLRGMKNANGAPDIRCTVYYQMLQCFKRLGDTDSISAYSSKYLALTDTLLHSGQLKALRDIEAQTNTARYNENMGSALRTNKNLKAFIIVISLMLMAMVLLGIWLFRSRRKLEKSNRELYLRLHKEAHSEGGMLTPVKSIGLPAAPEPAETTAGPEAGTGPDHARNLLAIKLKRIMAESPDIFNPDFSIDNLAALAGTPARKVSQTINNDLGMNFNTFLQDYRIKEACRRLEDSENYGDMTIEAISESLGFKSRGNFVQVFKKITGLTPSAYQKISRSH